MEIYLDLVSPPCRAVYLFAEALKIPYAFKLVELSAGQQYTEEFGKLSVVRKVPVLKDGSFVLTESIAILQYLVQKCLLADHWFPAELQQRARVNEYLSWQHLNLRSHCSKVFLFRTLYPFIMGSEAPKEKLDVSLEDMKQSLDLLEEKFLQDKPFIVGNKISVADVAAVVEVMQPLGAGVDGLDGRPKLTAWRERVKKELGVKLFDQAHEALLNSSGLQQKMQTNNTELQKLKPMFLKYFR
ncbi:glutathione S-transferase theta-3-like [Xiphophorus maculatus]|uniref:glutathione transferase n=1 Tax=Xiphophorus maculatus TaxID=8083 RepID=M4AQW6_XIPMA|nr:glutathione S-transferase theta-3-like [Xiphophorus maculatus]